MDCDYAGYGNFMVDIISVLRLRGSEKILAALRAKGRMRYSDLTDQVGFATTTTRALKAMEKAKLVTREVLDEPYRPVVYALTERGRKVADMLVELEKL